MISSTMPMVKPDQSQMLAALGIPTGPGIPLPAGAGTIVQPSAASWTNGTMPRGQAPGMGQSQALIAALKGI